MDFAAVVLAAGKGTRMRSAMPKVLHPIAGRPMLGHVLDTARGLSPKQLCVVYGHGGDEVRARLASDDLLWAEQGEQLGTGHAVAQAMPLLDAATPVVLVLYGDVPLIRRQTLQAVIGAVSDDSLGLLTLSMENPTGYGRIVRDQNGAVSRIVEQKDASDAELEINEINTGILALPYHFLKDALPRLSNSNAQGEYYLTDLIAMAVAAGMSVETVAPDFNWEVDGVNDRVQLARLERIWQRVQAEDLMRAGVTLADPGRIDIRGRFQCAEDVSLDINLVIEGEVRIGRGARVGPHCVIRNAVIGEDTVIEAHSVIDGAEIGAACQVGPFARLRPGTRLAAGGKIGNFVETKNARIDEGSKVNHLSYIGDAEIGRNVNVGAGTITCNYDGANKSTTRLGDDVFIGSNSSLVAPVDIGKGATIGAGSVITRDVEDHELGVARGRQRNINGWPRPRK